MKQIRRPLQAIALISSVGYYTFDYWPETQLKYDILAVVKNKTQVIRAGIIASRSLLDYRINVSGIEDQEKYRTELRRFHVRTAERIFDVCVKSKGIYIKFGQYLSTLDRIIPKEICDVLKKLQDSVPPHEYKTIKMILDIQVPKWEKTIIKIEEVPIGSASLAQVHKGTFADGTEVAIKVKYPELNKQFRMDLISLSRLAKILTKVFSYYEISSIDVEQILNKFKISVTNELDFEKEIENAEFSGKFFEHNDDVVVPKIYQRLSSINVITMEYLPGVRIDDVDEIRNVLKLDPKECGNILIDTYMKMIFDSGRIHCDPHPGNLLIRKNPLNPKRAQLILLDHGFYRILSQEVQQKFTELWMALINGQNEKIKEMAKWFGIEKMTHYLGIIFLFRTKNVQRLGDSFSPEEVKRLREKSILSFDNLFKMLDEFPEDIIMIIRCMNMISMRNMSLGNSNRDRLLTTTRKVYQKYYNDRIWWGVFYACFRIKMWVFERFLFIARLFEKVDPQLDM